MGNILFTPDGQKLYDLPDLLFWLLTCSEEDSKLLLGSVKLYKWLRKLGYHELAEKSKYIEDPKEMILEIKSLIFKRPEVEKENFSEALAEFIRLYI
ncbi:MAG TPA: hypothetical protein EYH09_00830 [Candidatus Nanopusillus sp.]|nr:hypothetical protein [Candidatus Nanopusillus sp.]HIP90437.1 hypothetical protein [Candidatus Nanopusillus sp.]